MLSSTYAQPQCAAERGKMKSKLTMLASAVLLLIVGVAMIIYPTAFVTVTVKVVGCVLAIIGLVGIITTVIAKNFGVSGITTIVGSVVSMIIGAVIFFKPDLLTTYTPYVIGGLISIYGIINLIHCFDIKKNTDRNWAVPLALSAVAILAGIIIILFVALYTALVMDILIRIAGIIVVYSAGVSIWINLMRKTKKDE